jgi:hypothetical protein
MEEPEAAAPRDHLVAARPAWTAEPEQFKSPTPEAGAARGSCPSPWSRNRTGQGRHRPCLYLHRPFTEPNRLPPLHRALQHRLAGTPRSGAAAPGRCRCGSHGPRRPASSAPGSSTLLVTTSSPPCPEREVSTEAFTLLWTRPSSQGWTEPCELTACVLPVVPHRAATQTRCRLRAGHRAEPVICRCRCLPQRARSLLCIVLILSRRAHAEFRLAVGTHTLSTPPSSEGPAFLGQELCEHRP